MRVCAPNVVLWRYSTAPRERFLLDAAYFSIYFIGVHVHVCRLENREVGANKAGYAIIIYTFIHFSTRKNNNFKFIKFQFSQRIIIIMW